MSFWRLVHNENIKLYKRNLLWIVLGTIVGILIINIIVTFNAPETHHEKWKEELETQIEDMRAKLDDEETFPVVKTVLEKDIIIKQYQVNNNISPLYEDTTLGFVKSTIAYSNIITLIVIVISSSIVSQEYSWGTIKLLLMKPVHRGKIILAKYVSIVFGTLISLLILLSLSLFIGLILFDWENQSFRYVYEVKGSVKDVSIVVHFLQYLGSKFIGIIMIASFAIMISTLFKSNTLAIVLSIVIEFSGTIISNLLINLWNKDFPKYLFFTNTDLYQYVEGAPKTGMTLNFSIIVLLIYFIVFMTISIVVFMKRDVVN